MGKIRKIFTEVWPTLRRTCRRYPVELALALFLTLLDHFDRSRPEIDRLGGALRIDLGSRRISEIYIDNVLLR